MGNTNKVEHSSENKSTTNEKLFPRCKCLTCKTLKTILENKTIDDDKINHLEDTLKKISQLRAREKNNSQLLANNFSNKKLLTYADFLETVGFLEQNTSNKIVCRLCKTKIVDKDLKKCPWMFHIGKNCSKITKIVAYVSNIVELFDTTETKLSCLFYRYHTFDCAKKLLDEIDSGAPKNISPEYGNNVQCCNCEPSLFKTNAQPKSNAEASNEAKITSKTETTSENFDQYEIEQKYCMAEAGFFMDNNRHIKCFSCKSELKSKDLWEEHANEGLDCDFAVEHMPEKLLYRIEYEKQFDSYNYSKNYISMFISRRYRFNKYINKRNKWNTIKSTKEKKENTYGSINYGTFYFPNNDKEKPNAKNLTEDREITSAEIFSKDFRQFLMFIYIAKTFLNCFKKQVPGDMKSKELGIFDSNFLYFNVDKKTENEKEKSKEVSIKKEIKYFCKDYINAEQEVYTTCVTIIETSKFSSKNTVTKKNLEVFFEMLKHVHQQFNDQYGGLILITNGIKTDLHDPVKKIMTANSTSQSENTNWNNNMSLLYVRLLGISNYKALSNLPAPLINQEKKNRKRISLDDTVPLNPYVTDYIFIDDSSITNSDVCKYQDYSYTILSEKSVSIVLIIGNDIKRYETLLNSLSTTKNKEKFHNFILLYEYQEGETNWEKDFRDVSNKFRAKITFICLNEKNFRQKIINILYEIFCIGCKEQLLQLKLLDENQIEHFKTIITRTCNEKNLLNLDKKPTYLNLDNIFINHHFVRYNKLRELLIHESVISPLADFTLQRENIFQMMLFWAILCDRPDAAEFFLKAVVKT